MTALLGIAQQEAIEKPYPEPIPTDEAGLYEFIAKLPPIKRWLVHAWLWQQHGRNPEHWEYIVDPILAKVANDESVAATRKLLRQKITDARSALFDALNLSGELAGDRLYDVEHVDGGDASLFRHYLEEADRALRTADLLNPTREAK